MLLDLTESLSVSDIRDCSSNPFGVSLKEKFPHGVFLVFFGLLRLAQV